MIYVNLSLLQKQWLNLLTTHLISTITKIILAELNNLDIFKITLCKLQEVALGSKTKKSVMQLDESIRSSNVI